MGNEPSSLQGKCAVREEARPFTMWLAKDVLAMEKRWVDYGAKLTWDTQMLAMVLDKDQHHIKPLFKVFDTDHNDLIDAFETMATLLFVTSMTMPHKLDFVFGLFDFGKRGRLTMDETIMLIRSLSCGLGKLDPRLQEAKTSMVEEVVMNAYARFGKSIDDELSRDEFQSLCATDVRIREALDFVNGAVGMEHIPVGGKWKDGSFDDPVRDCLYIKDEHEPDNPVMPRNLRIQFPCEPIMFFMDSVLPISVAQGFLGTSWIKDALNICLSSGSRLMKKLFLETGQEDVGRYCLQFFIGGNWKISYVDERVIASTIRGQGVKARCFAGPEVWTGETWMCLVEKALAKLLGSYEALLYIPVLEGLEIITGGVPSSFELCAADAWEKLVQVCRFGVAGAIRNWRGSRDEQLSKTEISARKGFRPGTVYAIHGVKEDEDRRLVQVRCGRDDLDDVFSWMCWDDFIAVFDTVLCCQVFDEEIWYTQRRHGCLERETSGGNLSRPTWFHNDQHCLTVKGSSTVFVTMYQEYDRDCPTPIGVAVIRHDFFDSDSPQRGRIHCTVISKGSVMALAGFDAQSSVTCQVKLEPGRYVIVPMTYDEGLQCNYTIVTRSNKPHVVEAHGDCEWIDIERCREEQILKFGSDLEDPDMLSKLVVICEKVRFRKNIPKSQANEMQLVKTLEYIQYMCAQLATAS